MAGTKQKVPSSATTAVGDIFGFPTSGETSVHSTILRGFFFVFVHGAVWRGLGSKQVIGASSAVSHFSS